VEECVKMAKKHLRKVISTHQRDWDEKIPIFLLSINP
jgi:hypothetical protein